MTNPARHVNFICAELLVLEELLLRDAITHQEIRDCFLKHGASLGELRELDTLLAEDTVTAGK